MSKRTERGQVVRRELEGVALGDDRRTRRALEIADLLARDAEASLPDAMGDRARVEALYRHLSSEDVTLAALLESHIAKTVERIAGAETVYAVADSTEFLFAGASRREGLGRVNGNDQGFLAHVTFAVAPDRTPLGLLGIETWNRAEPKGKRTSWARQKDTGRESLRWGRGMRQASERLGSQANKLVHVADREGDIYELLSELTASKRRFIIRASQDRVVEPMDQGDETRLFDAAPCTPTAFVLEVPLSARVPKWEPPHRKTYPRRRQRTAQLSFAARTVTLHRPRAKTTDLPPTLSVNIVHVIELGPPPGEPPVEWVLLTSERVQTSAQVESVVSGYRARWLAEEYFKAIKTGCAFESRQLESAKTLEALLAYTLIVAYALLLLRSLSRQDTNSPAPRRRCDQS